MTDQEFQKMLGQYSDLELKTLLCQEFKKDILLFARQVITEDPHDMKKPWKHLPVDDIPYVKTLLLSYVKDSKILVEKSRQVMCSWIFITAALWEIMFHKSARIAMISKKSDDVRKMLERMKFMYEHLEGTWKPKLEFTFFPLPRVSCEETHSMVMGFPQGADQLRSDTFTTIISDEYAFQDDQERTWVASKPTIDGGGKFIAISTPNGQENMFYRLRKSGDFKVHTIHYSMNPFKTEAWKAQAFSGLSEEAIQQEYEINYLSSVANKIYQDFNPAVHVRSLVLNPTKPLYVGWDFGYNRPAIVFSQLYDGRLFVLKSILGYKVEISTFVYDSIVITIQDFKEAPEIIDYCDIAGKHKNDQTGQTTISVVNSILSGYGRVLRYRKTENLEASHNLIRRFMTSMQGGQPCYNIDPSNRNLIEGNQGGYHYHGTKENICGCGINEYGAKEKGVHKHLQDCVRYVVENVYGVTGAPVRMKLSAMPTKAINRDKRFDRNINDYLSLGGKF